MASVWSATSAARGAGVDSAAWANAVWRQQREETAAPLSALRERPTPGISHDVEMMVLLDLENLACIATELPPMQMMCAQAGVEFRAYTTTFHDLANRATHTVASEEREAVDVEIVWVAANFVRDDLVRRRRVLVVTDDRFGRTLASIHPRNVEHAGWSTELSATWTRIFNARTFGAFFEERGFYRERSKRPSLAGSNRSRSCSRASWSRPAEEEVRRGRGNQRAPSPAPGAFRSRADSPYPGARHTWSPENPGYVANTIAEQPPRSPPLTVSATSDAEDLMTGTIKCFDSDKGYGFIIGDNTDVFVHVSNLMPGSWNHPPSRGDGVEFQLKYNAARNKFKAFDAALLPCPHQVEHRVAGAARGGNKGRAHRGTGIRVCDNGASLGCMRPSGTNL
eukprot:CAMPEP_0171935186 /NCGR_PEP_ID=MMETSP0993-20121228/32673_1 /TAXON_ID=483369 /ORGANISM="non described non described, Strain CCMP2098" /LENGTH=394 /DNA_ID=CAMNT_0012576049 /DNA_START=367 /DNA_END=1552 /DNA_ORIENTATION=-